LIHPLIGVTRQDFQEKARVEKIWKLAENFCHLAQRKKIIFLFRKLFGLCLLHQCNIIKKSKDLGPQHAWCRGVCDVCVYTLFLQIGQKHQD